MNKKLFVNKKIFIGFMLFLLNFFCFYFFTLIDNKYNSFFFLYFNLFFILIIVFISTKEMLNIDKKLKKKIKIIYFISVFFNFFYFLSLLINFFIEYKKYNIQNYEKKYSLLKIIFLFDKLEYFLFFLFCLWMCFLFIQDFKITNLTFLFLILIYIVFCSTCFFTLIFLNYKWFFYLFIITISSDSFSFLGGRLFGYNLLFAKVSPKKTWEGFFIGLIVTFIIILLFFSNRLNIYNIFYFLIFSLLSCIISSLGDLIASKLKREFSIKDFDSILPGHGGILDRFDSLLFLSFFIVLFLSSPFSCFNKHILEIIN
ncbi:MAG: phosphatidate cytidylyltransferase [Candidatus Phytoplasma stylosanthis]|nr:phosphatidate cytidylyltransferase [Candidatus Phytoplasma stylosanthis]